VPLNFGELAQHQGLPAERCCWNKAGDSLALLQTLSPKICNSSAPSSTPSRRTETGFAAVCGRVRRKIVALETAAELDDYTLARGRLRRRILDKCARAFVPGGEAGRRATAGNGIRFGKGLQLVNILRDFCRRTCAKAAVICRRKNWSRPGLRPAVLLSPVNEAKFLPFYHRYLDAAESHLAAGWAYTNSLPRGCMRVQLACAWPILIGRKTIERLRAANVLDLQRGVKISPERSARDLVRSVLSHPLPGAWQKIVFPDWKKLLHPAGNRRKKASCKFPSCCPRFCVAVICASFISVRAADTPVQAALRAALDQKMAELDKQQTQAPPVVVMPSGAVKAPPAPATPPPANNTPATPDATNPTGGYTNNVRAKRCSRNCSRAAS